MLPLFIVGASREFNENFYLQSLRKTVHCLRMAALRQNIVGFAACQPNDQASRHPNWCAAAYLLCMNSTSADVEGVVVDDYNVSGGAGGAVSLFSGYGFLEMRVQFCELHNGYDNINLSERR
ncbi:hypothetical protein GQX74_000249 [Glossina fuscipes]|uniref:Uncharacterized protein n=1 Tax=Glossina palpalis gambiensis TaxID=67801 RepID=A0A1B0ATQ0_9MUSC|nr:hypothetical protein GQX74_000249 [Glossina fuscipes]